MSEVITTSWEEHPMYRIDHRDPGSVLASADRLAAGITGTIRSAAGIYQSMPPGNLPDLYWSRLINARECAAVLLDYLDRVVQESPHQPPRITAHREEPGYRETKRQEIVPHGGPDPRRYEKGADPRRRCRGSGQPLRLLLGDGFPPLMPSINA